MSESWELADKKERHFRRRIHAMLLDVYDEYSETELANKLGVFPSAVRLIKTRPFQPLGRLLTFADSLGYKIDVRLVKKDEADADT